MGAEDQCDREVDKGQVNASESREDGVKLSSDGEVAGKAVVSKDVSLERFDEADLGRVCWRGNGVWNGQEDVNDTLVSVVRDHDQLVDVVVTCVGPVIECSTTEVLVSNRHPRKVRLLSDIINSLQTPEEKRKTAKAILRKGHGCPRKSVVSTSEIVYISLSDSDLLHRQETILKEAATTLEFGKLLGAKTIGCEAVIVQDSARILTHSQ
ncbi:hypothetical protein V6N13_088308 [Hibiscus sabdariffa]|uniref:Uncharacterized protein n=1 Tax=Hibiscus sabdariffa TaxID=183260 RepID=A0ABR2FYY0_9ROSI